MAYNDVVQIARDGHVLDRVIAAAAGENVTTPDAWTRENIWHIAASPGWADAWASAKANYTVNLNPNTGERTDVITDGMILSAVQARLAAQPAT